MKNASSAKNSKSGPPAGAKNMATSQPAGTKPMPRVGGHTTNITPSQGVPGGAGGGKGC